MAASIGQLEKLLSVRDKVVAECERDILRIRTAIAEVESILRGETGIYFAEREQLNDAVRFARLHEVPLFDCGLEKRKIRMMEALRILRELRSDLDVAEQNAVQARRQAKIVVNLLEKVRWQDAQDAAKREQRTLDDFAGFRNVRRLTSVTQED